MHRHLYSYVFPSLAATSMKWIDAKMKVGAIQCASPFLASSKM